jgi:hypothetical protein
MSYSLENGAGLPFLLAVPKGGQELRPVLCFLHGFDEGAPTPIEEALTRHGPLRPGNPVTALEKFIIVAPQMPICGDFWLRYADQVHQSVKQVRHRFGGDPQRTYLTGFSFGGNGVFDLALNQPGMWAALWAVDPTRVPDRDPGCPVWLSIGILSRPRQKSFAGALGLNPLADPAGSDRIIHDQGADHAGSAMLAYRDERIYSWLLSKKNKGDYWDH